LKVPDDAAYTIFAPTNKAFADSDVVKRTGLTAAQLLLPANKKALTQVSPTGMVADLHLSHGGSTVAAQRHERSGTQFDPTAGC
jgi:hypothetical protein